MRLAASLFAFADTVKCALSTHVAAQKTHTVEADIAAVSNTLPGLVDAINAFPSSSNNLTAAFNVHLAAQRTDRAARQALASAKTVALFSESESDAILEMILAMQPTILDALVAIAARRPSFETLMIPGATMLARYDLTALSNDVQALGMALTNAAPDNLKGQANAISASLDAAFLEAIDTYS